MEKPSSSKTELTVLRNYFWMLLVLWTILVGSILSWSLFRQKRETEGVARVQARNSFEKDIVYRRWAAGHGGVYVPMTDKTPPNPYLSHMEERDITTPSGQVLTLVNPAYMTRRVHELGLEQYGSRGHITSLKPIRPANAADKWETKALRAFEQGVKEVSSIETLDNQNYMRLMRPMITEQSCLKCHAEQGYKVGDLRGGISVSVPMAPIQAIAMGHILTLTVGHFVLWLLGVGGISFGGQRLKQRIQERRQVEEQIENLAKFPSENPNPVLRITKDGKLLYANDASSSLLTEWDCREGQTVPDYWCQVVSKAFTSGKQKRVETEHLGRTFSFEITPVFEADYANLYGRDITERKQAEEAVQSERQRFFALLEKLPAFVYLQAPDHSIRFANRYYRKQFGDTEGVPCYKSLWGRDEPCEVCPTFKVFDTGQPQIWEWDQAPDGRCYEIYDYPFTDIDGAKLVLEMGTDITERKETAARQELAGKILERLNRESEAFDMVRDIITLVKEHIDFAAVGIRLRRADDFPYFIAKGFGAEFIEAEKYLCARDQNGEIIYDSQGKPVLECMCGNVLSGRTDSALPFFTEGGSFWTNSTTKLLASTSPEQRMGHTRNRCNQAGYESMALIPLRSGDQTVGLLQLNDTLPDRFTPEMISFLEGICASIGIALARIEAEQEIKNLAKFPSENPNPVLRIAKNGVVLYANGASGSLLAEWGCQMGQTAPKNWCRTVSDVFASGSARRIEISHADSIFAFMIVPVVEADYVNLYGRDITERKKAQETLEASEEQFRRAVLDAPFPIMIHAEDGEVLQISKVWTDLTGYTPQEIPTLSAWTERAYGDRKDIVKSRIDKIFDYDKRVEEGEYVISSKDGKTLIWDFSSAPLGKLPDGRRLVISMAMDITERKQVEEQVRNLAKFPSESPYPVLRIAKDGTILYANSAGSELLEDWGCEVGSGAPEHWCQYVLRILRSGSSEELEVACRDRIFSLITAPVVEAGYVNIYGIDVTERKRAEEDLRKYRHHLEELVEERTGKLTEANKQLLEEIEGRKRLEKEILNISEREQQRLGEELHDSLGQQLTGVAFMTKVLEQKLTAKSLNEAADVAEIAKLVNQATVQARGLARGLRPVDLDASSLMSSLQELAASMEQLFGVRCTFKCDKPVEVDDTEVAVHLYRIAQEAVTNAIKHSRAKNIRIGLTYGRNKSVMTIKSDGLDFPKEFEARGTGMGLQIMDHRADIIGGSLDIRGGAKGGTIVTCEFPGKKRSQ